MGNTYNFNRFKARKSYCCHHCEKIIHQGELYFRGIASPYYRLPFCRECVIIYSPEKNIEKALKILGSFEFQMFLAFTVMMYVRTVNDIPLNSLTVGSGIIGGSLLVGGILIIILFLDWVGSEFPLEYKLKKKN